MLYQFPPPRWYESGTTSHFVVTVVLWLIALGLPASVFVCLIRPRKSPNVLPLAMAVWSLSLLVPWILLASDSALYLFRDQSPLVSLVANLMLAVLPLPAIVAGWEELQRRRGKVFGFSDMPAWGCAVPIGFLLVAAQTLLVTGHHPEANLGFYCKSQLKQIGLAMHNFHDQHGQFPDSQMQQDDRPVHSWRVELLPFLDQKSLFDKYEQKSPWDAATNQPLATTRPSVYACPAVPQRARQDSTGRWYSAYATLIGPNTAFPNGKGLPLTAIPDGASNTVLLAEACGRQIVWTEPRDIETTSTNIGINLPGNQPGQSSGTWSSYHRGSANTLFVDGSVRSLSVQTDPRVLRAITTANGGEGVGEF